MNFVFQISSRKNGIHSVTAPERFRGEIEKHTWCIRLDKKKRIGARFYVLTRSGSKTLLLHRLVYQLAGGAVVADVDHIDGNGLNNSEENIRGATHAQNLQNRPRNSNNKSGYKGVFWHTRSGRWRAKICASGKTKWIGDFVDPRLAAFAYNEHAIRLHGEFAVLNDLTTPIGE